jgi:carbon-monoxide dehydrogenase catalytic subunit
VSGFFYEQTQELLGSVMVVEIDPAKLAERILEDFDKRRKKVGW